MIKRIVLLGIMSVLFLMGAKECTAIVCAGGPCNGTGAPDLMVGSGENDRMFGLKDSDLIGGNEGGDKMFGGKGDDFLTDNVSMEEIPFPVEQFYQQAADERSLSRDDLPVGVDPTAQGSATPDSDEFYGGDGDDDIDSADGQPDKVKCGAGDDEVMADPEDKVDKDCEGPSDNVQRIQVN